jgi:hypothetical protein
MPLRPSGIKYLHPLCLQRVVPAEPSVLDRGRGIRAADGEDICVLLPRVTRHAQPPRYGSNSNLNMHAFHW